MSDVSTDKEIGDTITGLIKRFDDELFALTQEQLFNQWFFEWNKAQGISYNLYEFSDMLENYKSRCRRWKTHHHGSTCVVERARDKYLMPRIREFTVAMIEAIKAAAKAVK